MDTDLSTTDVRKSFEFTGNSREYFSIWIVNVLLTILTLGIYSAWAKVRTNQYFYGNTHLDNNTFRYLADPKQILKGRIIAGIIFAAYYFSGLISPTATIVAIGLIMLLMPAFVVMSMSFQMRNSAYRNIRFNFEKDFKRAYALFTLPALMIAAYVSVITFFQPDKAGQTVDDVPPDMLFMISSLPLIIMLLFPWWEFLLNRFKIAHASFGTEKFSFLANTRNYYGLYLKGFLIMMLAGIVFAIMMSIVAAVAGSFEVEEESRGPMGQMLSLVIPLFLLPFYIWVFAYFQTKKTNLIYNNIVINDHKVKSDLEVGEMTKLYLTNTLAMALSLGLLMPWAKVRTARYRAGRTSVQTNGEFDRFVAAQVGQQSALGEGMSDIFDLDLGM